MPISQLGLHSFRNLERETILFQTHGINVIHGKNGSGKTSILEAIHAISCGKSFRTSDLNQLISHNAEGLVACALVERAGGRLMTLGISREIGSRFSARLEGGVAKFSELARLLPVRMISPVETVELISEGPEKRRSFLDWGLFHVKHNYWELAKQFNKVLKQKNAALKARCSDRELTEWNRMFDELGTGLDKERKEYLQALLLDLEPIVSESKVLSEVTINYSAGWEDSFSLKEGLEINRKREREVGYSLVGPHRSDMVLKVNDILAKEVLSRGQQKLLAISLFLAQGELLKRRAGQYPIYLIDDFTSELDQYSQELLLKILNPKQKQIILTVLEINHPALQKFIKGESVTIHHIRNGVITQSREQESRTLAV